MTPEQRAEALRLADWVGNKQVENFLRVLAAEPQFPPDYPDGPDREPEPQGEPFAWAVCSINSDSALSLEYTAPWEEAAHDHIFDAIEEDIDGAASWVVRPLYLHPAPAQTPLTDKQIDAITDEEIGNERLLSAYRSYARAIERAIVSKG